MLRASKAASRAPTPYAKSTQQAGEQTGELEDLQKQLDDALAMNSKLEKQLGEKASTAVDGDLETEYNLLLQEKAKLEEAYDQQEDRMDKLEEVVLTQLDKLEELEGLLEETEDEMFKVSLPPMLASVVGH